MLGFAAMLTAVACLTATDAPPNPHADPGAIVQSGGARFTVLTPQLIRLEFSANHAFEDRSSLAFINRRLPLPEFKTSHTDGWLTIDTGQLVLKFREDAAGFTADTLHITLKLGDKAVTWKPGMKDDANLLGTVRTLDGVSGSCPLPPGLLSRGGWALVDDSSRHVFNWEPWPWAEARAKNAGQDWYFFGYGHDYKNALLDFTRVAGRIPLPPRYMFGAWWSRYWAYSDSELRDLVKQFRDHDVPLDILVVDMDWHLDGWTGYTWNPTYFPDPDGFLTWVHAQGLRVTLNLHPADGVGKHEKAFPEFARAMGKDPAKTDRIPFDCTDPKYVDAYFKLLHHPMERAGVDFWWMDWQQGLRSDIAGLDPLWWLNYLHWTDMERNPDRGDKRPAIFSRWGGLGNHRYEIGFSGDTYSNWPSLAFQPYFTATAGNVGYAYWSHDIGGHMPGVVDPELYVRWIQWGALSPALRTHTTKNPKSERRIWAFSDEYFHAAREAFRLRYGLLPYIYTAARQCYDTAIPLCRPLYYEWPDLNEAYRHPGEYLFGDQLLVAPVAQAANPASGCADVQVWLPPGEWTHWFTGRTIKGPADVTFMVPLDEIPLFVRTGAVIPGMARATRTNERPVDPLILHVFPGRSSETRVYDDDGISRHYRDDQFAWTPLQFKDTPAARQLVIGPTQGSFPGVPERRHYEIRVHDAWPPHDVRLNGELLAQSESGDGWSYDDRDLAIVIRTPAQDIRKGLTVELAPGSEATQEAILRDGLRGQLALLDLIVKKAPTPMIREFAERRAAMPSGPARDRLAVEFLKDHLIDVVAELMRADVPTKLRQQLALRLLGLSARMEVHSADSGDEILASAEVVGTLADSWRRSINASVAFDPPKGWQVTSSSETGAPSGATLASARVQLASRSPRTGQLVARVSVKAGGEPITFTMDRLLLPSIGTWWVLGPIKASSADLKQVLPPEEKLDLEAPVSIDGRTLAWRRLRRPVRNHDVTSEFYVDLQKEFAGARVPAVAYAAAFLKVAQATDAVLQLGSDDGAVVWVNGRELLRSPAPRAYAARQDRIPVHLNEGVNTLLLKVGQVGGGWGFAVYVETPDGEPMPEIEVIERP